MASPPRPTPAAWSVERLVVVGLGLVPLLLLLPWGTVHPSTRAVAAMGLGAAALLAGRVPRVAGWLLLVAWAPGLLATVPLTEAARLALRPGLEPVLAEVRGLVGAAQALPLAVHPHAALVALGFAAGLAALVALSAARLGDDRALATTLVAGGCLAVALAGGHRVLHGADGGGAGFFPLVNPNHGAVLCATLLPVAVGLRRAWSGLAVVVLGAGLALAASRGGWITAGAGVALALVLGPRGWPRVFGAVALGCGGGVLALAPLEGMRRVSEVVLGEVPRQLLGGRETLWGDAWRLVDAAWPVGVGPGGYGEAVDVVSLAPDFTTAVHAHQEALQVLAEGGVGGVGVLLVAGMVLATGVRRVRGADDRALAAGLCAATLTLGLACLWDFPLRVGALAALGAVLAGWCLARDRAATTRAPQVVLALGALMLPSVAALAPPGTPWSADDLLRQRARAGLRAAIDADDVDVALAQAEAADQALRKALAIRPLQDDALRELAEVRRWLGDARGERACLEAAAKVHPSLPITWLRLARHLRRHEPEAARLAYREMLRWDFPRSDDDRVWLEEALASAPGDPGAVVPDRPDRLRDAALLVGRSDPAAALALMDRAVALDPGKLTARAELLLRLGRLEEAWAAVGQAEGCGELRVAGRVAWALERPEVAAERLERAAATCPDHVQPELALGVARARASLGDPDALAGLRARVAASPADVAVRRVLMEALGRLRLHDPSGRAGVEAELVRHLDALVAQGVATERELAFRARLVGDAAP